ncbi:ATP-dependent (S)-NAD(P)H-hydrate dehydratase [Pseudobythopirellula maris]|uniref:ADP-dependent (S)-NAD(P)H-hydrate dehydratase n=1 Tax=Pseudobythopirellula maris TaxID=2527991 RepID=A0A5C5ZQP8_9BACT|nr:NAD(P)H-hydrate dehydratase [Pseudobythopirellula maris]TWT89864.1 ATP-dependent (S)-NAD(P)H-hydrate dehydratase [Pseudobythopirellula maris]
MKDVSQEPLPLLAGRGAESHKGDFGRVLLIGGAPGMAGSIAMSALSCLRSGAGLVTVAAPAASAPVVASFCPVYMTVAIGKAEDFRESLEAATVVAIGPGLGENWDTLLPLVLAANKPTVIDADGLNALARGSMLENVHARCVLTPHPGEYGRLVGDASLAAKATGDDAERVEAAGVLARRSGASGAVLLKGARTVVADGERHAINKTGNPGMATGGSGDVLTGVIAGLMAQGLGPFDAARLGAHVHGVAGDLAAARLGQISMIATDLIDELPHAFQRLDPTPF